jgi:hypothetical protein
MVKTEEQLRKNAYMNAYMKARYATPEGTLYQKAINDRYRASDEGKLARRAYRIKYRFKISVEEYDHRLITQGNLCKICSIDMTTTSKGACLDHCHSTGKIRGFLCNNCNLGIGLLGDTYSRVKQAVDYLEEYNVH